MEKTVKKWVGFSVHVIADTDYELPVAFSLPVPREKLFPGRETVVYDYKGTVSCVCPKTGTQREMAYRGFEESRGALKYGCPALHYGIPVSSDLPRGLECERKYRSKAAQLSFLLYLYPRDRRERGDSRL